jgi:hypothetical protein
MARAELPGVRVLEAGVGLARPPAGGYGECAISCGLAGGLEPGVPTGTVLIPRTVERADGSTLACDASLVDALLAGARALGIVPREGPLLTSRALLHGAARTAAGQRGFTGVDMETGAIPAARVAAVRVVLDTPERELSPAWLHPLRVILQPAAWAELPWLAREGPRCARLAARVVAAAIRAVAAET